MRKEVQYYSIGETRGRYHLPYYLTTLKFRAFQLYASYYKQVIVSTAENEYLITVPIRLSYHYLAMRDGSYFFGMSNAKVAVIHVYIEPMCMQ